MLDRDDGPDEGRRGLADGDGSGVRVEAEKSRNSLVPLVYDPR